MKRTPKSSAPSIKIEDSPVRSSSDRMDHTEFLHALRDVEVGQSFLIGSCTSYERIAIRAAAAVLGRLFITRKDGDKVRVGRVQ